MNDLIKDLREEAERVNTQNDLYFDDKTLQTIQISTTVKNELSKPEVNQRQSIKSSDGQIFIEMY